MASGEMAPIATIMASAMGRSKWLPSLGRSAGARLTVMCLKGRPRPTACNAFLTRSRLSATALSGRPTMASTCWPELIRTCTSTGLASMPTKATVAIWPYMRRPLGQPHCSRNLIGADPERQEQIRNNQLPAPYRFVRSQRLTSSWPINFFAMSSVRLPAGSNLLAAAEIMTSGWLTTGMSRNTKHWRR